MPYEQTSIYFILICRCFGHSSCFSIPHSGGGMTGPSAAGPLWWNPLWGLERQQICPKRNRTYQRYCRLHILLIPQTVFSCRGSHGSLVAMISNQEVSRRLCRSCRRSIPAKPASSKPASPAWSWPWAWPGPGPRPGLVLGPAWSWS